MQSVTHDSHRNRLITSLSNFHYDMLVPQTSHLQIQWGGGHGDLRCCGAANFFCAVLR